jgi:hypothetical protein
MEVALFLVVSSRKARRIVALPLLSSSPLDSPSSCAAAVECRRRRRRRCGTGSGDWSKAMDTKGEGGGTDWAGMLDNGLPVRSEREGLGRLMVLVVALAVALVR